MKELLIDLNEYQENTTSIGLQFHSPTLSRESCFTLPFSYAGLQKERSTKEATDNFQRRTPCGNTKKFHYGKFIKQKYSTRSYYYKCVTTGKRGEISPPLRKRELMSYFVEQFNGKS